MFLHGVEVEILPNEWPNIYRHGSGLSATNIIKGLWLSVHVPRRTVPRVCWEHGEYDRTLWEMGLRWSQLHWRRLRCLRWYDFALSSWIKSIPCRLHSLSLLLKQLRGQTSVKSDLWNFACRGRNYLEIVGESQKVMGLKTFLSGCLSNV